MTDNIDIYTRIYFLDKNCTSQTKITIFVYAYIYTYIKST